MEISQGSMVITADGTVGIVAKSVTVNGVRFHRLRSHCVTSWGIVPAQGFRFVAEGEIIAVKQAAATAETAAAA